MMREENMKSSSSSKSISLPSFSNQGITTKNKLRTCCNVKRYQIRRVKNKGAILVLVISYLVTSALYFLANIAIHHPVLYHIWIIPFSITPAIAGWLTDAFIGRYKVIRCSIWIMWLIMIAITASAVVGQLSEIHHYQDKVIVQPILFCLISIGLGAFLSNIVQFGLDQLQDASTTEIKSFIVWYVNSLITTGIIAEFNFLCLNRQNKLYLSLLICACLTLALLLIIFYNKSLIKEPPPKYSFKLIYKVIKLAIVTKHPRRRSAFTYCEDELPSRIDFGKSKYGGPFTTEQVEDVKTLLRLLPLISIFGVIASVLVAANGLRIYLEKQYNRFASSYAISELNSKDIIAECYAETSLTDSVHLGILLLIVLHEIVIYPFFQRCICYVKIKSLWKILIGIIFQVVCVTTLMAFDVISRHNFLKNEYNATIQCIFQERSNGLLSQSLSYRWLAIPEYLHYISLTFLLTGIIEFICSQAPYSMKGVIMGAQYTLISICSIPILVTNVVILNTESLSSLGKGTISCEFWYALLIIAAYLSLFVILVWMVIKSDTKCGKEKIYFPMSTSLLKDTILNEQLTVIAIAHVELDNSFSHILVCE
jgi:peptide/histidine transporter 3/4